MVILTFVASIILTAAFYFKRRQLEARGRKGFWHIFFDKSLEFLIPFTVIAALFCMLSLFISGTSDRLTIEYLMRFEEAIGWIKSFSALFKLSAFGTGVVLIVFYLLRLVPALSKHTERMLPDLKKYKTFVRTAYTIIVILFSFTFFGVQSDKPAAELRLRIKENEKLYGELREEVEAAVRKEVADNIYFKIYHGLPRDYRVDMDRGDDGPEPPDGWPPSPNGDGGDDDGGGDGDGPSPLVIDLFEGPEAGAQPAGPTAPAPEHASKKKIGKAFEAIRRYRTAFQKKFISLLATDIGREMALQPPKALTSKIKEAVFKELTDNHPILEPVITKLVEMLDKNLEPPVQKAVDKITRSALQNPEQTRQMVEIEASAIVKGMDVPPRSGFSAKVQKVREAIARAWRGVTGIPSRPDHFSQTTEQVNRINEQIHLLICESEENRLYAVRELARGGARLTGPQVLQIKEILKREGLRFKISPTQEGMFVEVPVKYYAALTLEGMRSRHLTSADRVAAAETIYEVESRPPEKQYTSDEVEERTRV